jgi:hypothetical protein
MSIELGKLKGKIEIPVPGKMKVTYMDTEVSINRFWGGTERGASLQLTFENELHTFSHVQLSECEVKILKNILNENF